MLQRSVPCRTASLKCSTINEWLVLQACCECKNSRSSKLAQCLLQVAADVSLAATEIRARMPELLLVAHSRLHPSAQAIRPLGHGRPRVPPKFADVDKEGNCPANDSYPRHEAEFIRCHIELSFGLLLVGSACLLAS